VKRPPKTPLCIHCKLQSSVALHCLNCGKARCYHCWLVGKHDCMGVPVIGDVFILTSKESK